MEENISVRQWQEKFRAGAFNAQDRYTQCEAGWYDWFCRDSELAGRLKRLSDLIVQITEPFILDNYCIGFMNACAMSGPTYDEVQFEPLSGERDGKCFAVSLDNPHERGKWTLYTQRFGFNTPEYGCGHVREMVKYINGMARELEQGTRPPFLDEKEAAVRYILGRNVLYPSRDLQREGEHSYSFLDRDDGRRKTVHVARCPKDIPYGPGSHIAEVINGLYVYCPEDMGDPLPCAQKAEHKSHKKKEQER